MTRQARRLILNIADKVPLIFSTFSDSGRGALRARKSMNDEYDKVMIYFREGFKKKSMESMENKKKKINRPP